MASCSKADASITRPVRILHTTREIADILDGSESELSDISNDDEDDFGDPTYEPLIQTSEEELSEEEIDGPESDDQEPVGDTTALRTRDFRWKRTKEFASCVTSRPTDLDLSDVDERKDWSNFEYFSQYLDEDIIEQMTIQTNIRVLKEKGIEFKLTSKETVIFLGMSMFMSCLGYPRVRYFWQAKTRVPIIANAMTRDRFFAIRSNLKIVNDDNVSRDVRDQDTLWKIRPFAKRILQGCLSLKRPTVACIDEQMIPFEGASRNKQYVPGKPHPVGLKNFVLATKTGLVLDFEIYQGKTSFPDVDPNLKLGIGGAAVLNLGRTQPPGADLYFDRYFTTFNLLTELKALNISGTGTIMTNRVPKTVKCKFTDDKTMKKQDRGVSEMVIRSDDLISVVKWFDNKPILLASTRHGLHPEEMCKRWSKSEKKYIEIKRPSIVGTYNNNMGGVDLNDRMISFYRNKTRTKKWTVRCMLHLMDMAVSNSWLLYRLDRIALSEQRKNIKQYLEFKLDLAEALIAIGSAEDQHLEDDLNTEAPSKKSKPSPVPCLQTRITNAKHLPEMADKDFSARCRNPGCSARTKIKCIKCDVFLCLTVKRNCFKVFHTK